MHWRLLDHHNPIIGKEQLQVNRALSSILTLRWDTYGVSERSVGGDSLPTADGNLEASQNRVANELESP